MFYFPESVSLKLLLFSRKKSVQSIFLVVSVGRFFLCVLFWSSPCSPVVSGRSLRSVGLPTQTQSDEGDVCVCVCVSVCVSVTPVSKQTYVVTHPPSPSSLSLPSPPFFADALHSQVSFHEAQ